MQVGQRWTGPARDGDPARRLPPVGRNYLPCLFLLFSVISSAVSSESYAYMASEKSTGRHIDRVITSRVAGSMDHGQTGETTMYDDSTRGLFSSVIVYSIANAQ